VNYVKPQMYHASLLTEPLKLLLMVQCRNYSCSTNTIICTSTSAPSLGASANTKHLRPPSQSSYCYRLRRWVLFSLQWVHLQYSLRSMAAL